jgi:pimeloyl-ACP methyl ester carboxylesterase
MDHPETLTVNIDKSHIRVWRKGHGPKIGFLAGLGGLPRWTPFLDSLARHRTVIVPSLPGFPGGERAHVVLDTHLDWIMAVRKLLVGSDLIGADLVGSSVGGALAAEMAAIWPDSVRRLALIAPFGLFDEADPPADVFAQKQDSLAGLLCAEAANYSRLKELPADGDPVEWPVEQVRANEAAARLLWPLGNTSLQKRLSLISASTLLIWGEQDRVMPRSYAEKFAKSIQGETRIKVVPGAGHLAELDRPAEVTEAILAWMN